MALLPGSPACNLHNIVERNSDPTNTLGWTEIYRLLTSTGVIDELLRVTGDEDPTTQIVILTGPGAGPPPFWRLRIEHMPGRRSCRLAAGGHAGRECARFPAGSRNPAR